jgi:ferredoxin
LAVVETDELGEAVDDLSYRKCKGTCRARSGVAVRWRDQDQSLLELAEACDVPVRWSCRAGVCHNCESGLISGSIAYQPDPLDPPAESNVLIC